MKRMMEGRRRGALRPIKSSHRSIIYTVSPPNTSLKLAMSFNCCLPNARVQFHLSIYHCISFHLVVMNWIGYTISCQGEAPNQQKKKKKRKKEKAHVRDVYTRKKKHFFSQARASVRYKTEDIHNIFHHHKERKEAAVMPSKISYVQEKKPSYIHFFFFFFFLLFSPHIIIGLFLNGNDQLSILPNSVCSASLGSFQTKFLHAFSPLARDRSSLLLFLGRLSTMLSPELLLALLSFPL